MRSERRKQEDLGKRKNVLYIGGSILGIGIIAFVVTFVLYGNKMEEQESNGSERIAQLMQDMANEGEDAQSVSTRNGEKRRRV